MNKKILLGIFFLIVFAIAIERITTTTIPAFKPALSQPNSQIVKEIFKKGFYIPADGSASFFKSDDTIEVGLFAENLDNPRALLFDTAENLIVSTHKGDSIIRLRDEDNDGFAETKEILLSNQDRPHGIALHNNLLYVAEEERVTRYTYSADVGVIGSGEIILTLPKGGRHFTRSLAISADEKLYISIGSSCDTCIEEDSRFATILESNLDGSDAKIYADGLRNAVFIKFRKGSGELFATEMGRDHLGDELPPDEINIIKEHRSYGWPFCYGNQTYDSIFSGVNNCTLTEPSFIDLPAHVAPLGFVFIPESWGDEYEGDLLVAYHGSWNSSTPVGYSIARFKKEGQGFSDEGTIFLEGFLDEDGGAIGRPVDLVFDREGTLFMSDDKGGFIYAIRKK